MSFNVESTDIICVNFVNQQLPLISLQGGVTIVIPYFFVQWNIKGNREDDIMCGLFCCFLAVRQSGKKAKCPGNIYYIHRGRIEKEEQNSV